MASSAKATLSLPIAKPKPKAKLERYSYEQETDLTNAVLIVENRKFHVVKEILMVGCPVFKAMFQSKFKESGTLEVNLKGKQVQHVVGMLDYLYPGKTFIITDDMAAKLIPLAEEYQLADLKQKCVDILMKMEKPRLEIVTLAEKYGIEDLLSKAIEACAINVSSQSFGYYGLATTLDQQSRLPENVELNKDTLLKIYKVKLANLVPAFGRSGTDIKRY